MAKIVNPLITSNEELEKIAKRGWRISQDKKKIEKVYTFHDFKQAMGWMLACSRVVFGYRHHPDWRNVNNRVRVLLTTHDNGNGQSGLTPVDIGLSREFDVLFQRSMNARKLGATSANPTARQAAGVGGQQRLTPQQVREQQLRANRAQQQLQAKRLQEQRVALQAAQKAKAATEAAKSQAIKDQDTKAETNPASRTSKAKTNTPKKNSTPKDPVPKDKTSDSTKDNTSDAKANNEKKGVDSKHVSDKSDNGKSGNAKNKKSSTKPLAKTKGKQKK